MQIYCKKIKVEKSLRQPASADFVFQFMQQKAHLLKLVALNF